MREDSQEPKGTKELKEFPGLLKHSTSRGTKENQASKDLQESPVRKEIEAFQGYLV